MVIVTTNISENVTQKRESNNRIRMGLKASSLRVEGCGCFDLDKRPNFKSISAQITHHMTMDRQNITVGFKIRSIGKVSCEAAIKSLGDEGWSVWMIFCIVAGLTLPVYDASGWVQMLPGKPGIHGICYP